MLARPQPLLALLSSLVLELSGGVQGWPQAFDQGSKVAVMTVSGGAADVEALARHKLVRMRVAAAGVDADRVRQQMADSPSEPWDDALAAFRLPFTGRVHRALRTARHQAKVLGSGTEHLLRALVGSDDSRAARVLAGLGVPAETVRDAIGTSSGPGRPATTTPPPLFPWTRTVLAYATEEVAGLDYVSSEFVLLGLLRHGESVAAEALSDLGITQLRTRTQIGRLLAGGQDDAETADLLSAVYGAPETTWFRSWTAVSSENTLTGRIGQARRRYRRTAVDHKKYLAALSRGAQEKQYPGGAGAADSWIPTKETVDLCVWLAEAAATGIIGNLAYDALKEAVKRRSQSRADDAGLLAGLTDDEASYQAAFALSVFRRGCGFPEDPDDYHVRSVELGRRGDWTVVVGLTPHDAMPFRVTLETYPSGARKAKNVRARIW